MAKLFKDMKKDELVAAANSLKLMDEVKKIANDPEKIINAEYVTVLEAFKAKQDELNSDVKAELDNKEKEPEIVKSGKGRLVNAHERAKLKNIKYKYIVTDHQSRNAIEDDDETRSFPILYGNLNKGPINWNVGLHGNPQALPFSVAKKLLEVPMVTHIKNAKGEPVARTQSRFSVTKVDGWTQDEIDQLKIAQNTRKFKD